MVAAVPGPVKELGNFGDILRGRLCEYYQSL